MKLFPLAFVLVLLTAFAAGHKSIYDYTVKDINGKDFSMAGLASHRFMIVNVASKCKFTPQYKELQELYDKYKSTGFEIIAFPANNFFHQEPGTNREIKEFCSSNYRVSFKMMAKISVKGKDMAPIYHWLTEKELNGFKDSKVKWNFQKYLINEHGELVAVLSPSTSPLDSRITHWIESGDFLEGK